MSNSSQPEIKAQSPGDQSSSGDPLQGNSDTQSGPTMKSQRSVKSTVKNLWAKTMLDIPTVSTMIKGALGPAICLAAFQSDSFAKAYATTGYLVAIISILSLPIMPRGKFIRHIVVLVVSLAITLATVLLAIFCCVKARKKHTSNVGQTQSGPNAATYDSSAAGVAGVWLFFLVWLVNVLRFKFPQFTVPGIPVAILINIALVYAPQFSTMSQGIAFTLRTSEAMFTGVAFGIGVSLFIFPRNMRGIVFKEMTGYIMTMRKLMRANMDYIQSLETGDMFSRTPTGATDRPRRKEAQDIKNVLTDLTALHAKLGVDLPFAKSEVAIGKLGPDDLGEIFQRLRVLNFVITGFSSLNDIFERTTESQGWTDVVDGTALSEIEGEAEKAHAQSVHEWHQISALLKGPFQHFTGHIDDGFAHILVVLQLLPQKAAVRDLEASGSRPNPGDAGFSEHFEKMISEFRAKKPIILQQFCSLRGIDLPQSFFENPKLADIKVPDWETRFPQQDQKERARRQLYLILWMDRLLESIGIRVHDFCLYVDRKADSGKLSKKRLVVPGYKRFRKHLRDLMSSKTDQYHDEMSGMMAEDGNRATSVYLGAAYHKRKDPEHLPPETWLERAGDELRKIPHFFRSREATFGLRVALATMCAAIIGLVSPTRTFFIGHRGFWAQIMVAISMTPSAAQSTFGFVLRIFGTFLAMCTSLAVWYIVDGKLPGVIVLYWFVIMWGFFVIVKFPKFIAIGMIFSVTNTLIIGYGTQTAKIGVAASETSGQLYYPTYLLAPYRLATVAAGLALAWIWTIFPYPVSEHSELRRDLGSALYLLANYNSIMDEVVAARIRGEVNFTDPSSPFHRLQKARNKVYAKSTLTLQALRMHIAFLSFDVPIGGRFPKEIYVKIVNRMQSIFNFMTLVILATETFAEMCEQDSAASPNGEVSSEMEWLKDFRRLVDGSNTTNREFTTLLSMLSASVASGNPLPPYLNAPPPYSLAKKLDAMDRSILSIRHISEPGFAAFACLQIGTKCINDDVSALLRDVKQLVGEMDFSFHVVAAKDGNSDSDDDSTALKGGKND
ncbi:hypothetical protein K461DRAFT_272706 [Myriangium duriaei CBS 260.36]|uniref:ER transporter 6TM N-terminal domain-containing protein n=1 Tax=Myriangium duriaei CBS 260.36 TaxID=1168546 RepID=A0A9P4MKV0_9PEZI|nr:hypothetical protein K461DRAFT_272706 [Myriangium duriaei CBS 260.36]